MAWLCPQAALRPARAARRQQVGQRRESKLQDAIGKAALKAEKHVAKELNVSKKDVDHRVVPCVLESARPPVPGRAAPVGTNALSNPLLTGEVAAARRLDAEDATMRQVLAWAMDHDAAVALQLAVALAPWWALRGRLAGEYPLLRAATAVPRWAATGDARRTSGLARQGCTSDQYVGLPLTDLPSLTTDWALNLLAIPVPAIRQPRAILHLHAVLSALAGSRQVYLTSG